MEEDYEEGILSHQSPRLVAVRPELLPVPSGSWYGGFLHTLNALYGVPLASETDVYDAGMKRAEVFPRTFEQRNGNQASKQTSGMVSSYVAWLYLISRRRRFAATTKFPTCPGTERVLPPSRR